MFFCVAVGLWGGLIIGLVTEYFTSNRFQPVQARGGVCGCGCVGLAAGARRACCTAPVSRRAGAGRALSRGWRPLHAPSTPPPPPQDVADSCRTGAATDIIFGLALGYKSAIIPCLIIGGWGWGGWARREGPLPPSRTLARRSSSTQTPNLASSAPPPTRNNASFFPPAHPAFHPPAAVAIFTGFSLAHMYGIACAALGMLATIATWCVPRCVGGSCRVCGSGVQPGLHPPRPPAAACTCPCTPAQPSALGNRPPIIRPLAPPPCPIHGP